MRHKPRIWLGFSFMLLSFVTAACTSSRVSAGVAGGRLRALPLRARAPICEARRMSRSLVLSLLSLLICVSTPPVSAATRDAAAASDLEQRRRVELTLDRLLGQGDAPRDAALRHQVFLYDAGERTILPRDGAALRAAAAAAPRDRLVQWIWATVPEAESGCSDAAPCPERAGTLAALEPANAAAWLPVLDAAARAKDAAAVDAAIARMAAGKSYDDLYVQTVLAWVDVFARWPNTVPLRAGDGDAERPLRAIDFAYVRATFGAQTAQLTQLARACDARRQDAPRPDRMADCARLGRLMLRRGTSLLAQRMGRALQRRSGAELAPDADAARVLDWQIAQLAEVEKRDGGSAKAVTAQFEHLRASGSEQAALVHRLERVGIATAPPSDWQAPDPPRS
jgi:hypothetical protein